MLYFKTAQIVPDKGDAWTFYECKDDQTIVRHLTHIPDTEETSRVPDPIVKKLYRPELLESSTEEEFKELWGEG